MTTETPNDETPEVEVAEDEGEQDGADEPVTQGDVPPGTTAPPVDPNPEEPVVVPQTWDTDTEGAPIETDATEETEAKDNRAKSPNPSDRARKGDDEEG